MSATDISLERMVNAVEKVRERLLRATAALGSARVEYAVAGGNAIAAWVSSVDEEAVRNTQDVYASGEPHLQNIVEAWEYDSVLNGGLYGEDGGGTRSQEGCGLAQTY